jgi:hypothetical protein
MLASRRMPEIALEAARMERERGQPQGPFLISASGNNNADQLIQQ